MLDILKMKFAWSEPTVYISMLWQYLWYQAQVAKVVKQAEMCLAVINLHRVW